MTVATQSVGQIIVRESGGSTLVYEQGQTVDCFTVALVSAPAAAVYVNVSAAASPSEAAAAGARTVLVSIDGGVDLAVRGRAHLRAGRHGPEDGARPRDRRHRLRGPAGRDAEPERAERTTRRTTTREIRNVLAEVIDNDQAGIVIAECDGNTTVLQGAPPYGIVDTYTIAPTMAPALYSNVKVTLFFDDDNLIVTSTDPRFDPMTRTFTFDWTNWLVPAVVQVAAGADDPHWGANLDDQHAEGTIFHVVTSTDPNYIAQFGVGLSTTATATTSGATWSGATATAGSTTTAGRTRAGTSRTASTTGTASGTATTAGIRSRTRCRVSTSTSSGRTRTSSTSSQSDGSTLVAQGDPNGDTYTIRLTARARRRQRQTVVVQLQSDGQTIASDACGCDPRFTPGTSHLGPSVTFDSTNWWIALHRPADEQPGRAADRSVPAAPGLPGAPDERIYQTDSNKDDFDLVGGIRFSDGWFDPRLGRRPGLGRRPRLVRRPELVRRRRLLQRPRRLVLRRRRLVRRPQLADDIPSRFRFKLPVRIRIS